MAGAEGRVATEVVGIVAKAAERGLPRAVGPLGRGAEHAAEHAGERAAAHGAVREGLDKAESRVVPMARSEIDRIRALGRGKRPDPETYLPKDYIEQHLSHFDEGATRFMNVDSLNKYGIAQADGTSFVMAKSEVDDLIAKTGGDPRAMERELGLPDGYFNGQVRRVDIDSPGDAGLRMPSGNEAGANDHWIPGGLLPGGTREAVIDGRDVPGDQISVTDFP